MNIMTKTKLRTLRDELKPKVAQEDMARAADMRISTYRNAEQGRNVSYTTATSILRAMNTLREQRGLSSIGLDDLGLSIV